MPGYVLLPDDDVICALPVCNTALHGLLHELPLGFPQSLPFILPPLLSISCSQGSPRAPVEVATPLAPAAMGPPHGMPLARSSSASSAASGTSAPPSPLVARGPPSLPGTPTSPSPAAPPSPGIGLPATVPSPGLAPPPPSPPATATRSPKGGGLGSFLRRLTSGGGGSGGASAGHHSRGASPSARPSGSGPG